MVNGPTEKPFEPVGTVKFDVTEVVFSVIGPLLPPPPVDAIVIAPAEFVMVMFEPAVSVVLVNPVPLPMSISPLFGVAVNPVPPFATGKAVPE